MGKMFSVWMDMVPFSRSRTERGTEVILYLNSESEEFLEKHRVQEILDKYAKFLGKFPYFQFFE